MRSQFLILLIITLLSSNYSYSDDRYGFNHFQFFLYGGSSHFFGDMGGANRKGTNSIIDLNLSTTGYSAGFGVSRKLNNHFSLRSNFIEAKVRGADKYTKDAFRSNRNLSFRSTIHELSLMTDYYIYTFNKKAKYSQNIMVFAGFGVFAFNPQAIYKNQWYDLQPLGTEGQGLIPGKDKYKRISINIPFGVGYNIKVSNKTQIGLLLTMRKTFTDYIDDVSTYYYDNQTISEKNGEIAGILADRNLKRDEGIIKKSGSGRGNPQNNDNFAFVQLSYSRSFMRKKNKTSSESLSKKREEKKCYNW